MRRPIVSYCNAMEDIKRRLALIRGMTHGHSPFGRDDFDAEALCLNLRKTLEQMAFATLVAHEDAYNAAHADISRQWKAERILDRIAAVHPDYYPKPVFLSGRDERGVLMFGNVDDGALTREDFKFLYDKCSDVLHTWNPFRTDERVVNFERSIDEWALRIMKLLDTHIVRLAGAMDVWLVQMQREDDGKVHAYLAPAVGEDVGQPLPEVALEAPE